MGFAAIFTQVMFIFILIFSLGAFAGIINGYLSSTNDSLNEAHMKQMLESDTSFKIINATYYGAGQSEIIIYLYNDGNNQIDYSFFDSYLDSQRLSRSVLSFQVVSNTDLLNPELWDSAETLQVIVSQNLDAEIGTHRVDLVGDYGSKAGILFNV